MKKRAFSIVLVVLMILSVIPMSVFATNSEQLNEIDRSEIKRAEWLEYLASNEINVYEEENEIEPSASNIVSIAASSTALPIDEQVIPLTRMAQAFTSTNNTKRYTVLVLDVSGSMYGNPMSALKTAASKFCRQVLEADGENYVAIVTYHTYAKIECEFTNSLDTLLTAINKLTDLGLTNTTSGLQFADTLLDTIPNDAKTIKNILLLSDGMPNEGDYSISGPYSYSDYYYYEYANATYHKAAELKNKNCFIYTLGFFHNLWSDELPFARKFMEDLQNAGYYEVIDPDGLEFAFGEIGEEIGSDKIIPYEFKYAAPTDENEDCTATCYYSDNYFSDKASTYNPSLSTMSLCFELSAWGSNEDGQGANDSYYINKSKNARKLLEDIGFEKDSIEVNHYFKHKPETDSMGAVAAYKNTIINDEKCTVIAVASRGGGYEAEWAGNFDIGKSGQHEGFKTASNIVYDFLDNYINDHKDKFESKVKLWFAGYSRGAATIYLLAARLNKDLSIGGVDFEQDDFYVYCFEPPMGATRNDIRTSSSGKNLDDNIHLIVNPNDVVTKVAPRYDGFDFYRIGVNAQVIPTKATSSGYTLASENMLEFYKDLETKNTQKTIKNNKHIVDTFQAKRYDPILWDPHLCFGVLFCDRCKNNLTHISNYEKPMNVFLDDLVKAVSFGIKNRATYVNELQQAIKIIMSSTMGKGADNEKWQDWSVIFPEKIKNNIGDLVWEYAKAEILPFGKTGLEALIDRIDYYAIQSMKEAGFDTEGIDGFIPTLKSAIKVIARALYDNIKTSGIDDMITAFHNHDTILPAHYPELCLAWLMIQDENYNGTPQKYINGYRIIHINCPVDVDVYDSNNELVASIIGNEPQDLQHSIVSSFGDDGEKILYLPADDDYSILLNATDDGMLSYSVTEFNYDTNDISKMVNYYEIPITLSDTLNASVPQYSQQDLDTGIAEGTTAQYTLSINDVPLDPDSMKSGDDAATAVYLITINMSDENAGMVLGGGMRNLGSYAQVRAIANNNYEFEGWYIEDTKVSSDLEYRFLVTSDVDLIANFLEAPKYNLTITAETGGTITTGTSGDYANNSAIDLSATAHRGYSFKNWTTSDGGTFADANNPATTFIMPANATTVTANFKYTGSSKSSDKKASPGDGVVLLNGKETELELNTDGSVTLTAADISGLSAPILLSLPYKDGGDSHVGVFKKDGQNNIIPFSVYKDGMMVILISEPGTYGAVNNKKTFNDIDGHWAVDTVDFVASRALYSGIGDNKFDPDGNMTRAMFTIVLSRLDGADLSGYKTSAFTDVDITSWYGTAIAWAVDKGIVSGYGNGRFGPDDSITREQMAVILNNYIKYKGIVLEKDDYIPFADDNKTSPWAKGAIADMKQYGLIAGVGNNNYAPHDTANRAGVAQIFMNFIRSYIK